MRVLLVGGAGYIGAHTAVALLNAGHDVVVVDDLSNSRAVALARVEQITNRQVPFREADIRDEDAVADFLNEHRPIDAVVLLAGLKSVGESVADPVRYYDVNVGAALSTLRIAARMGIDRIVFSSSATVYGDPKSVPIDEAAPTGHTIANPYGQTKHVIEQILRDVATADERARIVILRYFNPVGAHPSGLIGEDPNGIPTNLMPIVSRVASGKMPQLSVFGDDFPTPDGTGLRDYIDVNDVAIGHVAAVVNAEIGVEAYNLGTGRPTSVLELVREFERASGQPVAFQVANRRPGDVASSYADPSKAERHWNWRASRTLADSCAAYWRWQLRNPDGYR